MRWRKGMRSGLLAVLAIGASACAANGTWQARAAESTPYPPPGYAHTVSSSQVALYWNCSRSEPGVLHLTGVAVNPWSDQAVRRLEFDLVGVDARGRSVSEAKAEVSNLNLGTNQSAPFSMDLRTTGTEVRFDLYYDYQFQEGDHHPLIAKAAWGPPILLAQTNRLMVHDACSETQHLVR